MYYKLYDTQTQRDMATGYNTTSFKELCDEYISYKSIDFEEEETEKHFNTLLESDKGIKEIITYIRDDEFLIESSLTPFKEYE